MRSKISRAVIRLAVGVVGAVMLLLCMGKIGWPEGTAAIAQRGGMRATVLGENEAMCLVHNPLRWSGGKLWSRDEAAQSIVTTDGTKQSFDGFEIQPGTLMSAIKLGVRLTRPEVDIPDELARLPLQGDWLVREGSSTEKRMAALQDIVRRVSGKDIVFEKRVQPRVVAIAKGVWARPAGEQEAQIKLMNLRSGEKRLLGANGDVKAFLRHVANEINMLVVDEINEPRPSKVKWDIDFLPPRFLREQNPAYQFLLGISNQTMLGFDIVDAHAPVWFVRERGAGAGAVGGATTRPGDPR